MPRRSPRPTTLLIAICGAVAALLVTSGCYVRPSEPDLTVRRVQRPTRIYGDSTLIEVSDELARLRPGIEIVSIAGISPCHVLDDMIASVRAGKRVVAAFSGVPAMGNADSCMQGRDSDTELAASYVNDLAAVVAAARNPNAQVVIALATVWRDAMPRSLNLRAALIAAGDAWGINVVDAAVWVSPEGVYSDTQPAWWWESPQQDGLVAVRGLDGGHQCLVFNLLRTLVGPACDANGSPGVRRYALGLAAAVSV